MHGFLRRRHQASFSEIQRIDNETYAESSGIDLSELCYARRTNGIIYALVSNRYATLKELRDDYSIDEVLDLYEICMTNMHNRQALLNGRRE